MASAAKPHHVHPTPPFRTADARATALKVVEASIVEGEARLSPAQKADRVKFRKVLKDEIETLRAIG